MGGAELLIPGGKKGHKQESDVIIINKIMKYIMIIEAKLTISNFITNVKKGSPTNSATKQLGTTKDILEKYFCKDISTEWDFIGAIFYEHLEENTSICQKCEPFVIRIGELKTKLEVIESPIQCKKEVIDQHEANQDYRLLVKNLIFTVFANPGPVLKWNMADKIFETITMNKTQPGQGEYRSILFWTPTQFQIMQLDEENIPRMPYVLFISSMSTGKTECMKGMIEKLLQEGQNCHFILFNQRCPKKTLLQMQLEVYFQNNKNRANLEFSFLNSDATDATQFYSDLNKKIWSLPGYNTFVDELTLPGRGIELAQEMQAIVPELRRHPNRPCLWIAVAGMNSATRNEYSIENFQKAFPDFFLPILRFPLRNCKRIIKYVLAGATNLEFDHDGDSGKSFLDIDVPDNLMEGLEPINVGLGYTKMIENAMKMVVERQGDQGVAVLFNFWDRSLGMKRHNKIVKDIKEGIKKAGRKDPVYYSSDLDPNSDSEEKVSEWIRDRGSVDLVADLSVARGWEDRTVVVVDCNQGIGVENLFMRAVANLYVVRTEKKKDRIVEEGPSV